MHVSKISCLTWYMSVITRLHFLTQAQVSEVRHSTNYKIADHRVSANLVSFADVMWYPVVVVNRGWLEHPCFGDGSGLRHRCNVVYCSQHMQTCLLLVAFGQTIPGHAPWSTKACAGGAYQTEVAIEVLSASLIRATYADALDSRRSFSLVETPTQPLLRSECAVVGMSSEHNEVLFKKK
jgi:hypothetical protein